MRSRSSANEQVAEVARRRLELLSAELAGIRREGPDSGPRPEPSGPGAHEDPGELSARPGPRPTESPGRHARRSVGPVRVVAGWLHDRLPPTLQGRVQIGSSHLTVVAVLVAAALAMTAWMVVRADAGETVVPASAAPTPAPAGSGLVQVAEPSVGGPSTSSTPVPAAGPAADSATATLVVDVEGKVRRPGIVSLPLGSRVVDALEAAGGVRGRRVDLTSLNLARLLVDGEQVVVGLPPPAGVAASAASAAGQSARPLVNINTADQTQLESLPGVGPVTAQAILKWRTENGAFSSVDELLEVSGIGEATLAELAPFVTL